MGRAARYATVALLAGFVLLLCMGASQAVERPWPPHAAEARFVPTATDTLPQLLRDALRSWGEFSQGKNTLPDSLQVAPIDLNGDRVDEFIVESAETYSGGPQMYVFERRDGRFVEIANMQGSLYLAPRVNGYYELVSQSRGGGGSYTRQLHQYRGYRYRVVRMADYEHGDGGPWVFLREREVTSLPVYGAPAGFTVQYSAAAVYDESWTQLPGPGAAATSALDRAVWTSASSRSVYDVIIANAPDAATAELLMTRYLQRISQSGRPMVPPRFGADQLVHWGTGDVPADQVLVRWGSDVVAIVARSMPSDSAADMVRILDALRARLKR